MQVRIRDGRSFTATRLISAMRLNVLKDVVFDPPLTSGKTTAQGVGYINKCVKVHAECRNVDLPSWSGVNYPRSQPIYAIADGTTPSGDTHIMAFGSEHNHLTALQTLVPMDIERVVFHNWANDEFAKGVWFFP